MCLVHATKIRCGGCTVDHMNELETYVPTYKGPGAKTRHMGTKPV